MTTSINKVGVIGLGLMGHGIVQAASMAPGKRYEVVGLEATEDAIGAGKGRIEASIKRQLSRSVARGKLTEADAESQGADYLSRISYTTDRAGLADCDLVIEAITENPAIKLPLYTELGLLTKPSCILASNTSSLKIADMAGASGRPDRVVGLHFFNPVQVMKLVEVVRTDATDPAVFEQCRAFVNSIGKHPVSCKDTPGFIVNRLLVPALAQAMLMVDRGDASVEDIDKSMELGAGHPMGPLALADYVGLDTCLFILQGWVDNFPSEPAFVVPDCLRAMVDAGKLGRKSGEGFYKWEGDKRGPVSRL
ncbi:hydroxyacyl-coenzyme A dehydrogenase [Tribonema minus]|uniref:Hydroxyacyl-coenzyme A dehydrogenase n=1 Tax=Tribonema minus TaxID=303371 RepID=A0A835YNC1_9STRA|nr:hydroxyacyl-coenzyme A dehydrogenase [Tribonema minus]